MNLKSIGQRISKFFLGGSNLFSSIWGFANPKSWNKSALLKQNVRYVYAIVSAIAQEAAKVQFEVGKKGANGKIIPITNHDFIKLMEKPNPLQSQFQFLELHFSFLKIAGESYWYLVEGEKSKKPKETYLLAPDKMEVVVDKESKTGLVKGYKMRKSDGTFQDFELKEILHFKMPNIQNPYYGFSPIEAAQSYIQTEEYSSEWTKKSLYNSGRPSGIVNIKSNADEAEFKQLQRQFKQNYEGIANTGKTFLIQGEEVKFTKLGMELDGIAMKELKDLTRDDIMIMLRVSKTMLGITDDVNRANSQTAKAVFIDNIIKPELDRLVDHLNAFLMPMYGKDLVLEYQDPTMITDEQLLEMFKAGHNKWLTTNDIRRELDYDEIDGGDVIREPINLVETQRKTSKALKKKVKSNNLDIFRKLFFDIQSLFEKQYQNFMVKEFKIQLKEILDQHKGIKKGIAGWEFNLTASNGRILAALVPFGLELIKETAKIAFGFTNDTETEFELNERIQDYVNNRTERFATDTNNSTQEKISQTISEGMAEGENLSKLTERVREVYKQATDVRAELIARTESLAVSNEGALEAYRQSPLVIKKEWSAEADACEFCSALNGKVIGLESSFAPIGTGVQGEDGGLLNIDYENIGHPPLHPNCRCAILPVAE